MRSRTALVTSLFFAAVCPIHAAAAQMHVPGHREVDPRLTKQHVAAEPSDQLTSNVGGPITAEANVAVNVAPTQVQLQRPSYLQPKGSAAANSGPTALQLMTQCFDGSISGSITNGACIGYLAGFIGAVRIGADASPNFPICLPDAGLPNEAIVAEVSAYLEQNPDSLEKSARSVVFFVLSRRFPCR